MQEVLGDAGLFSRGSKSKTECWVEMTMRLNELLGKSTAPEGVPKHIEILEKKYNKLANSYRVLSEPKRSLDQKELEKLMAQHKELKDEQDLDRAERENDRNKDEDENRKGGEAIRNAALSVERAHRKKSRDKRVNTLEFLVKLDERNAERREQERREQVDREEKREARLEAMQAQQVANQLEIAKVFAMALQSMVSASHSKAADHESN